MTSGVLKGGEAQFFVTGGEGPWQWFHDGVFLSGQTQASLVVTNVVAESFGTYTAVSGDGRAVSAELKRVLAGSPGSRDTTFDLPADYRGILRESEIFSIAEDASRRILVAFGLPPSGPETWLWNYYAFIRNNPDAWFTRYCTLRFHSDGTVDRSFMPVTSYTDTSRRQAGVVPLSNGQFIFFGDFLRLDTAEAQTASVNGMARFNPDGSLDQTFVNNYISHSGLNLSINGVEAVTEDKGRLLVAAGWLEPNEITNGEFTPRSAKRRVIRLNSDGTMDPSFSAPVFLPPSSSSEAQISSIVAAESGKTIVAGSFVTSGSSPKSGIVRLHQDGSLDSGFDASFPLKLTVWDNGYVERSVADVRRVEPLPDGRFLVIPNPPAPIQAEVLRLFSDGRRDPSFHSQVFVASDSSSILQKDGKIIFFGTLRRTGTDEAPVTLVRLHDDGSIDSSFNQGDGPIAAPFAGVLNQDGLLYLGALGAFVGDDGYPANSMIRLFTEGFVPEAPSLRIVRQGADLTLFFRPTAGAHGYQLEASGDLKQWKSVYQGRSDGQVEWYHLPISPASHGTAFRFVEILE